MLDVEQPKSGKYFIRVIIVLPVLVCFRFYGKMLQENLFVKFYNQFWSETKFSENCD